MDARCGIITPELLILRILRGAKGFQTILSSSAAAGVNLCHFKGGKIAAKAYGHTQNITETGY